jgi:hypothetical protein
MDPQQNSSAGQGNGTDVFADAFGGPVQQVLDLKSWSRGADLSQLYPKLRQMVAESVEQERRIRGPIRQRIFPQIRAGANAMLPPCAGVYRVVEQDIKRVHCGLLFNGGTECCDGNVVGHSALTLSVYQIGMALVRYRGDCGTWVHQLYRRDMYARMQDPVEETMTLLAKRLKREPDNAETPRDPLTRLVRRALMDWGERAILTRVATALWRMGHGNPISYSLLIPITDELVRDSMAVLKELVEYRRFVYVSSEPSDQFLLTIGNALYAQEFAIVGTLEEQFGDEALNRLADSHGGHKQANKIIHDCIRDVRTQIVVGVYRATAFSPARVFYAHRDYACEAAAIAISDSVLQPYRGFPMLIDLADIVCGNCFDSGTLTGVVHDAYAAAGEPTRYLGERETRS